MINKEEVKGDFSVLMSVYYKENAVFLRDCLDSIYSSTLRPGEVILVEDGPLTNELYEVVSHYKEKKALKTVRLESNKGLGIALNIGLKECKYELVARMDADDICEPERFMKEYNYLIENKDTVMIGGSIIEYTEDLLTVIGERSVPVSHEEIINKCYLRNPFNHMTVMFRKSAIISIGGYKDHPLMEDYNLWLRLISTGAKVINLSDILVKVRGGNKMVIRRSGITYIKSEYRLMKLINELKITSRKRSYVIFLIRAALRILPVTILSKIYSHLRK